MSDHAELARKFVESFEVLGENLDFVEHLEPVAAQLANGPADSYGQKRWKPLAVQTESAELEPLYGKLPSPFRRCMRS